MKPTIFTKAITLACCMLFSTAAFADARDQARHLFTSLTGTVPSKEYLDTITKMVKEGDYEDAAFKIIKDNPSFYSVTVKNLVTPWTNRDKSIFYPLNDFSATVIGAVRDNLSFSKVFYDDMLYYADGELTGSNRDRVLLKGGIDVPLYFRGDNRHYEELQEKNVNLADPQILQRFSQTPVLHKEVDAIAGVLSTRTFGEAFLQAGTNRRPIAFLVEHMLCRSLDQLNDTTRPDFRVRRDIDRNPGGDSRTYKALCVGCHAGMDPLAGAFSYYDFRNSYLFYDRKEPEADSKVNHNVLYPDGYITTSDSWLNIWAEGQNSNLGWPATKSGNGAASFGKMFSQTKAFPKCMSKQVFTQVCSREPKTKAELQAVNTLAAKFVASKENMKALYVNTAITCMGE